MAGGGKGSLSSNNMLSSGVTGNNNPTNTGTSSHKRSLVVGGTNVGIDSATTSMNGGSDPYRFNNNKNNTNNNKNENNNKNKIQWLIVSVCMFGFFMILWNTQDTSSVNTTTMNTSSKLTTTDGTTRIAQVDSSSSSNTVVDGITKNPIQQITILGERNSGTRWTFEHLSECFNHSIKVKRGLTRYKHWFQHYDTSLYPHDTLVISQFRNSYEWLKAMEHVPHHAPAHLRTATNKYNVSDMLNLSIANNDWEVFLSKPWTTERVGSDLLITDTENTICQENFKYKDIISCAIEPLPKSYYNWTIRYSEHQPFYEMRNDGSGLPYDNITEMRTDKIRNFLNVSTFPGVSDLWVVQYEYLVGMGTRQLLDRIAEYTGLSYTDKCVPKESQYRAPKRSRMILPEYAQYIREHIDWSIEELIGYKPVYEYEEQV